MRVVAAALSYNIISGQRALTHGIVAGAFGAQKVRQCGSKYDRSTKFGQVVHSPLMTVVGIHSASSLLLNFLPWCRVVVSSWRHKAPFAP